jgi:hypothetical protein
MILYVASYAVLSSKGQYVPGLWHLSWVESYIWAPRGFVSGPEGIKQNRLLQCGYFPLWWMDLLLMHRSDHALNGKYPVNTLFDAELRKSEKIFEQNQKAETTAASRSAPETNRP